ncbi:site-specific recombinase, phage integrase family [Bacteriovorax sp. BAL6_X]|uniref:tyrosine-type recombinase/integrase n=1 Tax=Bacteriovorax sp. BAL6_X TaxID=1201290 RepID=UPI000385B162|nr:site-specific integrase [Bacteriovorax sp. BAL6_X]EPZ49499.1 site-specific recombinase, phage integrase family [Bacteriovorax sp. BAL6_X]
MAIRCYEKDGKKLYQVYVNARSKTDRKLRVQKTVSDLKSLSLARREENRINQELGKKLTELEGLCDTWESVIDKWEHEARSGFLGTYNPATIMDHVASLRNWTKSWLKTPASELGKANGRDLVKRMTNAEKSISFIKKVKNTVNLVYNFGIEEGLIKGVHQSPVYGIKLHHKKEKVPDILTLEEIKQFLYEARRQEHPWYPIWATALLTGMRSGELYALEWNDVDFENEIVRVSKSFNKRTNEIKSTKAGYWRNVPMSPELKELFISLKSSSKDKFVLPRFNDWRRGDQSKILKMFLIGNGLPKIKFHALRACFATQLLAKGTPAAIVMKICGWRDLKTMELYIRVAGVDEKGATDCLSILPSEVDVADNVVSLFHS